MEKKVIYDNLTRGRVIIKDGFFTITPKVRKSYTFKSGLDGKVYNVQPKYSVEIEPSDTLFDIMKNSNFQSSER
jgi:hypothetical protein